MDQVKATLENGVLVITVPKEEVKKLDVKSIEIHWYIKFDMIKGVYFLSLVGSVYSLCQ